MNWLLICLTISGGVMDIKVVGKYESQKACTYQAKRFKVQGAVFGCVDSQQEVKPSLFTAPQKK